MSFKNLDRITDFGKLNGKFIHKVFKVKRLSMKSQRKMRYETIDLELYYFERWF